MGLGMLFAKNVRRMTVLYPFQNLLCGQLSGSDPFGPQVHLDPWHTWTPSTLGPLAHLDPGHTWTPGTLGPRAHLDPRNTWTPGTLGPQAHLDPGTLGPQAHLDPGNTWTLDIWTQHTWTPRDFMVFGFLMHYAVCYCLSHSFLAGFS